MELEDIIELDDLLCRFPLLNLGAADHEPCTVGKRVPLVFIPVNCVQDYWKKQSLSAQQDLCRYLLSSLNRPGTRFAFLIRGDAYGIHLYYGCMQQDTLRLQANLRGLFPGIGLGTPIPDDELVTDYGTSGVMIGQPGGIETEFTAADAFRLPVDALCSSMLGSDFTVMVLAQKLPAAFLMDMLSKVRIEDQRISRYQRKEFRDVNQLQENRLVQDYMDHLQMAADDLKMGIQEGMWSTSVYYGADRVADCIRLESLMKGAWMGKREHVYQPLHCIPLKCRGNCRIQTGPNSFQRVNIQEELSADCTFCCCLSEELIGNYGSSILDHNGRPDSPRGTLVPFNGYQYRTVLTTSQFTNYCHLPRHEYPGFAVNPYVEFDTAIRTSVAPENGVRLGNVIRVDQLNEKNPMENPYLLPLDDLTRHLLLVGVTGGGKSNSTKAILSELWQTHQLPFLVIESAKREYYELANVTRPLPNGIEIAVFPDLTLFTLGNEHPQTGIPYRLNPFEVIPGCSIQTHIDSLLSTFNAAFDLFAPLPHVLEAMVYEVYSDRGWDIVTNENRFGATTWPTLTDLYYKIDPVTDRQGYNREIQDNVKAALRVRLNSLRMGGKGAMMDVPRSIPLSELLKNPTVLELEDLGDDNTKAFVIGILMTQLYEYRKRGAPSRHIRHLLVIEEAHRLLRKVVPGSADQSREKAVGFFCDMLSEIRAYGQGIQICDQVPTRLADDALKNTNCKIVHRIVTEDDRLAVGNAMHMNPEQVDFLTSLPRGCAAVYAEGDSRPKLVRFPLVEQKSTRTRAQLVKLCRETAARRFSGSFQLYKYTHACRFCESRNCAHRTMCENWIRQLDMDRYWQYVTEEDNGQSPSQKGSDGSGQSRKPVTFQGMVKLCRTAEKTMRQKLTHDQELCLIGTMMQKFPMTELRRASIISNYFKSRGQWIVEQSV